MKLLRIEVENLNSLYGKQVVALEEQFGGEPLFLITGPTGAGKSTLMDAVSLALFGRTPRLAQGRGQEEQDPRLVLSRGTGKGGAVLEFSRLDGVKITRYRASWIVRRAHDKATGTLQAAERTLERLDSKGQWQTLVSSVQAKQFQPHFDTVLAGMTVDDFQRAVLLAQGQFAAFLQATEEERAKILERLTGTGHYLTIGQRASVKKREHEAAVQQAQAQLDAVQSLSADDEQRLTDERERLQAEVQSGQQALQCEQQALTWLQQADTLARQLAEAEAGLATALQAQVDAEPQLAQLAEHERCAVAADTLRTVDELTGQQANLQQQWTDQAATVATQTAAVAAAEPVAQAQQEALNQQRQAANVLRPEIGQARALYAQLQTELQKASLAETAGQGASQQAQEAEQTLAARRKDQAQQAAALQLAQQQLQLAQDAAPLVTAATGLHQQHGQLLDQHKALQARQQQVRQRQQQLEVDRAGHRAKAAQRQTLADQLAPKRADQAAAAAVLTAALAGTADPANRRAALRSRRDTLQQQAVAATQALEFYQKVELLGQQHKDAAAGLQGLQQAQEATAAGQQEVTAQLQALPAPQEARLAERKALQLLRDLVQERTQLQSEQPCPLCGSPEHPYVESGRLADAEAHAVSRCAELDNELAALEQQGQTLQARLQTLALDQVRLGQQVQQQTRELERLQTELVTADALLAGLLERLDLPTDCTAETLRQAHNAAAAEQLACSRAEQALGQAEEGQRQATEALQTAEQALVALDQALAVTTAQLDQQQRDLSQWQADAQQVEQTLHQQLQTLVSQLGGFGIAGPQQLQSLHDVELLAAALQSVSQRAAVYTAAWEAMQQATTAHAQATAATDQAAVRATAAAEAAATAAKAVATQQEAVQALQNQCQQVLQGRDPQVVEAELDKALQSAEQRAQAATAALQTARNQLLQAQTQHAATAERLATVAGQLQTQQAALAEVLQNLGLADSAALRQRLLPQATLTALLQLRQSLDQTTARAHGNRDAGQRAVAAHHLQRPTHLAKDAVAQTQALQVQTLSETLTQHTQQLAAIVAQFDQNNANHAQRDRLRQLVAARSQVYSVWQRLHALIGVADGKAFQKFAQILNLEELAGKANHHLQLLAPRYKLVVARNSDLEPRLDFAVEDEYQAEERRPLTTLSGGETFLVSLSLALALADYRAVQMPIETLLLDEGFGTLDPQTLASAMTALKALSQSSGVQVGLISHVESLKQEIAARVVVERQGNGRSVVRMEVGL